MEVKIKNSDNTLVDADWTIEDGVMVVSLKESFSPKNGDVIVCSNALGCWTLIVKTIEPHVVCHHAVLVDNGILKINDRSSYSNPRPATEEEKKLLFDKLAEKGLAWDAEKKELIELKWVPKDGDYYYYPACVDTGFVPLSARYSASSSYDTGMAAKGWCFKTQQKCKTFCDLLNEAISKINS